MPSKYNEYAESTQKTAAYLKVARPSFVLSDIKINKA